MILMPMPVEDFGVLNTTCVSKPGVPAGGSGFPGEGSVVSEKRIAKYWDVSCLAAADWVSRLKNL